MAIVYPRKACMGGIYLCMLLLLAFSSCGTSPSNPAPAPAGTLDQKLIKRVDNLLRSETDGGQFDGSVLVAQRGKILLDKAYGMADHQNSIHNQKTTKYRIGDLTGQFTNLAILLLQEQGKLDVQDAACKYLTSCPASWQPITISELMLTTSGLPDLQSISAYVELQNTQVTPDQLIASFADQRLEFDPGKGANGSDANYVVLGAIIEHVSGQHYADFVQHALLTPLNLNDTGYDQNQLQAPDHALGYSQSSIPAQPINMSAAYSWGALYSTPDDLYKFDQALFSHKEISQTTANLAQAPQYQLCGGSQRCRQYAELDLGYVWLVGKYASNGLKTDFETGTISGFSSGNYYYPDRQATVIILSNQSQGEHTVGSTIQSVLFDM